MPLLLVLLLYTITTVFKYFTQGREKRFIKMAFSKYLSPNVLKTVLENPELLKLKSVKKDLTVMFVDIVGFTTYSENHSPEEVSRNLNFLLTRMTEIVLKNQGSLDKYIGDCLMAFWGAPIKQENHAVLACKTAIEIVQNINNISDSNIENFKVGIGINSGEMAVGNMGSDKIMNYSVIGDNVNIASRVETLTRKYNVDVIITENVASRVQASSFKLKSLGRTTIKGKTKEIEIFSLNH
jgi:adenylate cyclase